MATSLLAQSYQERARAYIAKYKDLAIAEQQRTGIPASIKLGQGILETNAGSSELALQAKNHFGIKCKSNWTGDTYAYTDDAPDECFRKYTLDIESYRDHSNFLKSNKRYASCFSLPETDYAAWARELRKCGYATNPQYAQQLIKVIEDFNLQEVTYAALSPQPSVNTQSQVALAAATPVVIADPTPSLSLNTEPAYEAPLAKSKNNDTEKSATASLPFGRRMQLNGLDGFYARRGELLLESAIKFNIRYARLLELNDLPDAPLPADMFIYLERKKTSGSRSTHLVAEGENMLLIAQAEGMQLKALRRFNKMENNEEPAAGTVLQLQQPGQEKPEVVAATNNTNATIASNRTAAASDMLPGGKKPVPAAAIEEDNTAAELAEATPAAAGKTPTAAVNIANETAVDELDEEEETETDTKGKNQQEVVLGYGAQQPNAAGGDEIDRLKAKMDKAVYSAPAPAPAATVNAPAARPQAAAPAAGNARFHTVQSGETAFSISKKYNITMKQLIDWNQLDFGKIKVGQKLRVN